MQAVFRDPCQFLKSLGDTAGRIATSQRTQVGTLSDQTPRIHSNLLKGLLTTRQLQKKTPLIIDILGGLAMREWRRRKSTPA